MVSSPGSIGYNPYPHDPFDLQIKIKESPENNENVPADTGTVSCNTCGCTVSCDTCGCSGGSCPTCNGAC